MIVNEISVFLVVYTYQLWSFFLTKTVIVVFGYICMVKLSRKLLLLYQLKNAGCVSIDNAIKYVKKIQIKGEKFSGTL